MCATSVCREQLALFAAMDIDINAKDSILNLINFAFDPDHPSFAGNPNDLMRRALLAVVITAVGMAPPPCLSKPLCLGQRCKVLWQKARKITLSRFMKELLLLPLNSVEFFRHKSTISSHHQ